MVNDTTAVNYKLDFSQAFIFEWISRDELTMPSKFAFLIVSDQDLKGSQGFWIRGIRPTLSIISAFVT